MNKYIAIGILALSAVAYHYYTINNLRDAHTVALKAEYDKGRDHEKALQLVALERVQAANRAKVAQMNKQAEQYLESKLLIQKMQVAYLKLNNEKELLEKGYETLNRISNMCNLTLASVQFTNRIITGDYQGSSATDTAILAAKTGTLSTVTGAAFKRWADGLAIEYVATYEKLDALQNILINWNDHDSRENSEARG